MSRFDTIEISNPQFEAPNLRLITVKSPALRGRADISVYMPPDAQELNDLPVAILLHGVYGSHWAWIHQMGVHKTMNQMLASGSVRPMVLLMPSDGLLGDGSGYIPHDHGDYEAWIVEDVIDAAIEVIDQISNHSPMFITGLSMGGFGALRLGAKYADQFRAFSGHSSITDLKQMESFAHGASISYQVPAADDGSVLYWMKENAEKLPPVRFDCGKDDPLIDHNRSLHEQMTAADIPHQYEEFEGGHTHEYWAEHIAKSLSFFSSLV